MDRFRLSVLSLLGLRLPLATAQVPEALQPFVSEASPVLVLEHVRVIDGTGAAPAEDRRIDVENGRITRVAATSLHHPYPPRAKVLDLTGKTIIPGLVGMHEHLFYTSPEAAKGGLPLWSEMADSAPRLYLAAGVTSARTAGSIEPYADLALKRMIDSGKTPGPKLHITGPYLGSCLGLAPQMPAMNGPDDVARTVDYWAGEGVTSFKAFMDLKPED